MFNKHPKIVVLHFITTLLFSYINCIYTSDHTNTRKLVLKPQLALLLEDFKRYKLDVEKNAQRILHAGDLYEHSLWVYNAAERLLEAPFLYQPELEITARDKDLVALAALLHDIGKAGRLDLFNKTHPHRFYKINKNNIDRITTIDYTVDGKEHPCISFDYLASFATYYIAQEDNSLAPFDIKLMFHELEITKEEQDFIAILAGMHYEFGMLREFKITNQNYLDILHSMVQKTNYAQGKITEKLLALTVLVHAADIMGLTPVPSKPTHLFPNPELLNTFPVRATTDPDFSLLWGYITPNPERSHVQHIYDKLIAYFKEETKQIATMVYAHA